VQCLFAVEKTRSEEKSMDNGDDKEESSEGEAENGAKIVQKITIMLVCGNGKGSRTGSSSSSFCQADECGVKLNMAKRYNRRHKVCERHSKAPVVLVSSIRQRFCQQCSKYVSYHIISNNVYFLFHLFFYKAIPRFSCLLHSLLDCVSQLS